VLDGWGWSAEVVAGPIGIAGIAGSAGGIGGLGGMLGGGETDPAHVRVAPGVAGEGAAGEGWAIVGAGAGEGDESVPATGLGIIR